MSRRPYALLLLALTVMAVCLSVAFARQRSAALHAAGKTSSVVRALTAMLDQETGLRGYESTSGDTRFLVSYDQGRREYEVASRDVSAAAAGDPRSEQLASTAETAARRWQDFAEVGIAQRRESPDGRISLSLALVGKQEMDDFRQANTRLRRRLDERRDATLDRAGLASTVGVVALAGVLALLGLLRLLSQDRRSGRELGYRAGQREFSDVLQVVDSEEEAHALVRRHLERFVPGAAATVLKRNNSDNRLEAATPVPDGGPLAEALLDAEPRSCVAIRLGREHVDGTARQGLVSCGVCGGVPGTSTCQPLLVGGKVIGSVLVEHDRELGGLERRGLRDTVGQAAPVLANLRTIAMAENRAATDALTGLPNRRAMQHNLKRMAAQAGRAGQPLSMVAFDLDHFKRINDRYGHEVGDRVLAAVGACVLESVRDSDVVSRVGGEEFLVLAADTDSEGAVVLAEKMREAISREQVPGLLEPVTASFGVATIPRDAGTPELLLRLADRACYLAKERGRNRVERVAGDPRDEPVGPIQPAGSVGG